MITAHVFFSEFIVISFKTFNNYKKYAIVWRAIVLDRNAQYASVVEALYPWSNVVPNLHQRVSPKSLVSHSISKMTQLSISLLMANDLFDKLKLATSLKTVKKRNCLLTLPKQTHSLVVFLEKRFALPQHDYPLG